MLLSVSGLSKGCRTTSAHQLLFTERQSNPYIYSFSSHRHCEVITTSRQFPLVRCNVLKNDGVKRYFITLEVMPPKRVPNMMRGLRRGKVERCVAKYWTLMGFLCNTSISAVPWQEGGSGLICCQMHTVLPFTLLRPRPLSSTSGPNWYLLCKGLFLAVVCFVEFLLNTLKPGIYIFLDNLTISCIYFWIWDSAYCNAALSAWTSTEIWNSGICQGEKKNLMICFKLHQSVNKQFYQKCNILVV